MIDRMLDWINGERVILLVALILMNFHSCYLDAELERANARLDKHAVQLGKNFEYFDRLLDIVEHYHPTNEARR